MIQGPGKNWSVRAAICAAVVAWQIYDIVSASVTSPYESNNLRYIVIACALIGLVASLLKLSADN
jgi:hypothetical protein